MAGERLMCIWEAVHALDKTSSSTKSFNSLLQNLTDRFSDESTLDTDRLSIHEHYGDKFITYKMYRKFLKTQVYNNNHSYVSFTYNIEDKCWELCQLYYRKTEIYKLYENKIPRSVQKLWQVFCRLVSDDSYPMKILPEDTHWIHTHLTESISEYPVVHFQEKLSFLELLETLWNGLFLSCNVKELSEGLEQLHSWFVEEITQVGSLDLRYKKNSGQWGKWKKKWMTLSTRGLRYYDSPLKKSLDGETGVDEDTSFEPRNPQTSIFPFKRRYILRIFSRHSRDVEIAASKSDKLDNWLIALNDIRNVDINDQIIMYNVRNRNTSSTSGEDMQTISSFQRMNRSRKMAGKSVKAPKMYLQKLRQPSEERDNSDSDVEAGATRNQDEEVIKFIKEQKQRALVVFHRIDDNRDGYIELEEFCNFIKSSELDMDLKTMEDIFDAIDKHKNGRVIFEEFNNYITNVVMKDELSASKHELALMKAFLNAKSGDRTLNFREFTEFAQELRRSIRISNLLEAFDDMDRQNNGQVGCTELKKFVSEKCSKKASIRVSQHLEVSDQSLNEQLKWIYQHANMNDEANYIRQRWAKWSSFKRYGASGNVVMTGAKVPICDHVPGTYTLVDLACFNDCTGLEPEFAEIPDIQWISSTEKGKSGQLIFPPTFNCEVPVQVATSQLLSYYNCTLADDNQVKISMLYRHVTQDFKYEESYLADYVSSDIALGGTGLEKHGFSHLDCPLDSDSGYLLIGRMADETTLHLTAFMVPKKHTVYVAPNVIHSNDYLKGTWRTMLSDMTGIDHVLLKQPQSEQCSELRKVSLSFVTKM